MARRPHTEMRAHNAPESTSDVARARQRRITRLRVNLLVVLMSLLAVGALIARGASAGSVEDANANTVRAINGAPSYGPDSGLPLAAGLVDIAAAPSGRGYWVAAADGGVFARGRAPFLGSAVGRPLLGPIVGIAATPSGNGYWLAAADGGVFTFGDAAFEGALGGYRLGDIPLNAPIVAIASTPSGNGYWLLGGDGGVFAFGDAPYLGSGVGTGHALPFVAMTVSRDGKGYFLLNGDGGVMAFGSAHYAGQWPDGKLATGITTPSNGRGYQVARIDGSVIGFGGAASTPAPPLDFAFGQHPVVGIASHRGGGSWLVRGYSPPVVAPAPADISQNAFLKCTRAHESDSAGGYHAVSPGGTYRGAYQFLQSTWNNVARAAGRPDLVGVDPAQAAPADQDQLALFLYQRSGAGPWGGRCAGM
jgi:hypothetical protein